MDNKKIIEIYNLVADITKAKIEKEKETILSEETYRMISLTQSLFNSIASYNATTAPEIF